MILPYSMPQKTSQGGLWQRSFYLQLLTMIFEVEISLIILFYLFKINLIINIKYCFIQISN